MTRSELKQETQKYVEEKIRQHDFGWIVRNTPLFTLSTCRACTQLKAVEGTKLCESCRRFL